MAQAESAENGVCWSSLREERSEAEGGPVWQKTADLYSGAAGIALFLLELDQLEPYRTGRNCRYHETAVAALRWAAAFQAREEERADGFYIGTLGVCYALARAWHLSGEADSSLASSALNLARSARWPERCDVLDGLAGCLLGYLLLHEILREPWLLDRAVEAGELLLERAHPGTRGLYWGRLPWTIRGLCGLSHGASGVGLALLELGRYLGDSFWYPAAEAAFAYEAYYYVPEQANWRDFRKGVWGEESYQQQRGAYLAGDTDFFLRPFDSNAWCNGAGGIGLARLRAWEILGRQDFLAEANNALVRTRSDLSRDGGIGSATLCHGGGGVAELLLQSARLIGRVEDVAVATGFASQILTRRKERGFYRSGLESSEREDPSLFLGNAGIGYFLLRLIDPVGIPSILSIRPSAPLPAPARRRTRPVGQIPRLALRKLFPRTLQGLDDLASADLETHLAGLLESSPWGEPLAGRFSRFVAELLPRLLGPAGERLVDVWALEEEVARMESMVRSFSLLHMKRLVLRERGEKLLAGSYLDVFLFVDPAAKLVMTRWPWSPVTEGRWASNRDREPGAWCTLLVPRTEGVLEAFLPSFAQSVIVAFNRPRRCAEVLADLAADMELATDAEREVLEKAFLHQVREMIAAGFLCDRELEG